MSAENQSGCPAATGPRYHGRARPQARQQKRIIVKAERKLSLQTHHHHAEHWIVVRGSTKVAYDGDEFPLSEKFHVHFAGAAHRRENPGKPPVESIEVPSGGDLGEDDIVRFGRQ